MAGARDAADEGEVEEVTYALLPPGWKNPTSGKKRDKLGEAAEDKELAGWVESAGEASSTGTGAPLIGDDDDDEPSVEEAESVELPATGKGRVLR